MIFFTAGDSALPPFGLRLGTPALTSRGLVEEDFCLVAELLHRGDLIALCKIRPFKSTSITIITIMFICVSLGIQLAVETQTYTNPQSTFKVFKETLAQHEKYQKRVREIRDEVEAFAGTSPMPGLPEL